MNRLIVIVFSFLFISVCGCGTGLDVLDDDVVISLRKVSVATLT